MIMDSSKITEQDLLPMFHQLASDLPPTFLDCLHNIVTEHHEATSEELAEYTLMVLQKIETPFIARTVEENLAAFESGWSENLRDLKAGRSLEESLRPRYFRDSKFLRYRNNLIVSNNLQLEHDLFTLARMLIFWKYLRGVDEIVEIGAGSCQNLLLLARMFSGKKLLGLDWTNASSAIATELARLLETPVSGKVFNMMETGEVAITPGAALVTIHALEQIGTNHGPLLDFILQARPEIVVHYEPIVEFYDDNNLIDYLAILYSRKRNYLSGYYTKLKELEAQGKIEILDAYRPYLGGVIHESSLIIWRPTPD